MVTQKKSPKKTAKPVRKYSRTDFIVMFPKSIQESIRKKIPYQLRGQYIAGYFGDEWIEGDYNKLSAKTKKILIDNIMTGRLCDVIQDYKTEMAYVKKANGE